MSVTVSSIAVIGAALILAMAQLGRDWLWRKHAEEMDSREQQRHADRMAISDPAHPTSNGRPVAVPHSLSNVD